MKNCDNIKKILDETLIKLKNMEEKYNKLENLVNNLLKEIEELKIRDNESIDMYFS
jgi:hypothetical protein